MNVSRAGHVRRVSTALGLALACAGPAMAQAPAQGRPGQPVDLLSDKAFRDALRAAGAASGAGLTVYTPGSAATPPPLPSALPAPAARQAPAPRPADSIVADAPIAAAQRVPGPPPPASWRDTARMLVVPALVLMTAAGFVVIAVAARKDRRRRRRRRPDHRTSDRRPHRSRSAPAAHSPPAGSAAPIER